LQVYDRKLEVIQSEKLCLRAGGDTDKRDG
jgi:hypothetical protein